MADRIEIGGVPVEVVDDETAAKADFVVCARADMDSPFTDNVETTCCDCSKAVIHRPYVPAAPAKICIECLMMRVEGGHA